MKLRGNIKRRGLVVLLFTIACLFSGLASGKAEFFISATVLGLLLLIALAQAILQRPLLTLDVGSGQVVCGQAIDIAVIAHNPLPWPLFPVRLRLSLQREHQADTELAKHEVLLKPREKKRLETEVICPHRGEYRVLLHQFYAEDVFGLLSLSGQSLPSQELLSLPRLDLTSMPDHKHAAQEEEENQQGKPGQQGQLTAESRLYQHGDALRTVHWKKSASRRALFSRLREYSADYSCCLLVDTQPFGHGEEALAYEDRLCEAALCFLFSQLTHNRGIILLPGSLALQALAGLDKAAALLGALPFTADTTLSILKSMLENQNPPDTLFLLLGQPQPQLTETLEQLINQGCDIVFLVPTANTAVVADSLCLPVPLISIDPPFAVTNWLEV